MNERTINSDITLDSISSNNQIKSKDTISIQKKPVQLIERNNTWNRDYDIYDVWTTLERDSIGYLIYEPCNGSTPGIKVEKKYITVFWSLETPNKFSIDKIGRINNKSTFHIQASADNGLKADFKIRIVDEKKRKYLWRFTINWNREEEPSEYLWITTSSKYKKEFRIIDNPCPYEMKPEKIFLPLEYE